MTQQIKALTSKPESISGPTWWKRTDSHTLTSELHVHKVAYIQCNKQALPFPWGHMAVDLQTFCPLKIY